MWGISLSGSGGSSGSCRWDRHYFYCQIGFREPDFDRDPIACNLRTIGKEIEKARQTQEAVSSVSTSWWQRSVTRIMSGQQCWQVPTALSPVPDCRWICRSRGRDGKRNARAQHRTMLAPIVSSTRALSVVTKYWMKKYDRKPDFLVAEGPLAGGHLGFKREELDAYTPENYERELTAIDPAGSRTGNSTDCSRRYL